MQTKKILHIPKTKGAKRYEYDAVTLFTSSAEAWKYLGIAPNDTKAQLAFLAREATRRNRERANANVNAPNAPKTPEQKLVNMAARVINVDRAVIKKAQHGDAAARNAIIGEYLEHLSKLSEGQVEATA